MTKEQCWTVPPCSYLHDRPKFGPSCAEFVYPGCWHFDNSATSKIDDVLAEHGGILHVLPLNVRFTWIFLRTSRGDLSETFLLIMFVCGTPHSCSKVRGWVGGGGGGLKHFSVSQRPIGFGFRAKGLGPGHDNKMMTDEEETACQKNCLVFLRPRNWKIHKRQFPRKR